MPEFIVRAHSAPTESVRLLAAIGTGAHPEYLAQVIMSALFVSKGHREDVSLTLVLENAADYSRAITFEMGGYGDLGGQDESSLLKVIAESLDVARGLAKDQAVVTPRGVQVAATSFERLCRNRIAGGNTFLLDRKGEDLRDIPLPQDATFLLTDHVPMPRKLQKSLVRMGARPVSVGPTMLHASQCIVVVQNEFDRRG